MDIMAWIFLIGLAIVVTVGGWILWQDRQAKKWELGDVLRSIC